MLASGEPVELSKLLEGLAENHRLEVRNAGYRRAIEIIKSNAPEVERLASLLIEQRRRRKRNCFRQQCCCPEQVRLKSTSFPLNFFRTCCGRIADIREAFF
jgi:hypothetical protein